MTSRLEFDLPAAGEAVPFGALTAFVEHARHTGIADDAPVTEVSPDQDPEMLVALRIELDRLGERPADVRVPRADILELLDVIAEIDENDGDGRAHLATLRELRQRLTHLAIEH
ncbi:hypothetical protein [Amycolatopsis anabasis]|uniref:hypothetical protein n=1 Tax=Amycolatopsis anabasis TaxID=1840409 RepID=UPI00131B54F8|nr:hypothetical protein [Amycolatopsis anabasis]